MTDSAPKIVYSLLASDQIITAVLIIDGLIGLLTDGRMVWINILLVVFGLVIGLRGIRDLSTRVTRLGVAQLTWRGRRHLAWADVTGVDRKPRSLILSGTAGRIVIPVESFGNTHDTVSYIYSRLPPSLNVARAAVM